MKKICLALMIGNSRLHWGLFTAEGLVHNWDSCYLPIESIQQLAQCETLEDIIPAPHPPLPIPCSPLPLFLASVVPTQTALWQHYPDVRILTLENLPLQGLYPTLGIDRAIALYGAGSVWGFPMLVIDAGTALTFTGGDEKQNLVGGAILPGLGLQFATLAKKTGQLPYAGNVYEKTAPLPHAGNVYEKTAPLPHAVNVDQKTAPQVETRLIASLPRRYALNTDEAIQSGVIYTLLAGIKDFVEAWWRDFPAGKVVLTGGDRILLSHYLQVSSPEIATRLIVEENLILWGMGEIIKKIRASNSDLSV